MSDPQDHSQSESDEAQRFWGEYARRTRPGGQRSEAREEQPPANGRGTIPHAHECLEWCPICRTADLLRATASPELREQVQNLQRDALVTLRALLDAYLERSGERRPGADAVEDIPIE